MDAVEQLHIERACERLINRYCHLIDHGQASQVADLFVDDGVWANPEVTRDGRAAIAKGFGARQANGARQSRHVCSTAVIEVIDNANARGVTYLTLYRHDGEPGRASSPLDGQPDVVGEYRDLFVRTSDGWRFKRREFVRAFARKAIAGRAT
jgi:ketosteroid isomerase-like protein